MGTPNNAEAVMVPAARVRAVRILWALTRGTLRGLSELGSVTVLRDPDELMHAFRTSQARLERVRDDVDKPLEKCLETAEDQAWRDQALAEVVDELLQLTKSPAHRLLKQAGKALQHWDDERDEASLQAALEQLRTRFGPPTEVADLATSALEQAQRASLARLAIVSYNARVAELSKHGGPDHTKPDTPPGARNPGRCRRRNCRRCNPPPKGDQRPVRQIVDEQHQPYLDHGLRVKVKDVTGPWRQRQLDGLRKWGQAMARHGAELGEAAARLEDAHQEAVNRRLRAELAAQQEAQRRQEEAKARQAAVENKALAAEVAILCQAAEDDRAGWEMSGQELRAHYGTLLRKHLEQGSDGTDDRGRRVTPPVPGIPRHKAERVLAVAARAACDPDAAKAARHVDGLLTHQAELAAEQQRLGQRIEQLPPDHATRQTWAKLHFDLHATCEWLGQHWDGLAPLFRTHAPEGAEPLEAVLRQLGFIADEQRLPSR